MLSMPNISGSLQGHLRWRSFVQDMVVLMQLAAESRHTVATVGGLETEGVLFWGASIVYAKLGTGTKDVFTGKRIDTDGAKTVGMTLHICWW